MRRLAVVVVDHHKLLEANATIKLVHHAIKLIDVRHLNSSAPEVRRIQAVTNARHVNALLRHRLMNRNQLFKALANTVATASRVLEHQERVT